MSEVDMDETTNCPICWETYEEAGEHIPRLLPCTHTLCEKCVAEILDRSQDSCPTCSNGYEKNAIVCPECRTEHSATDNGVKTFPQNKYVLTIIRKMKMYGETVGERAVKKCDEHDSDLRLYCKEQGCGVAICALCLIQEHKGHDVVDREEARRDKKRDMLIARVEKLTERLNAKMDQVQTAKNEGEGIQKTCLAMLESRRDQVKKIIDEKFDELVEEASKELNSDLEKKMKIINEDTGLLADITENATTGKMTMEELKKMLKTVRDITMQLRSSFAGGIHYKYPYYTLNKPTKEVIDSLCGAVIEREALYQSGADAEIQSSLTPSALASQLNCRGTFLIKHCYRPPSEGWGKVIVSVCSHLGGGTSSQFLVGGTPSQF